MHVPEVDGHGFERLFGGVSFFDVDPKLRGHGVHSLAEGLNVVRSYQTDLNWNPRRPHTKLSQCMFSVVASKLKHKSEPLFLFNSVGTVLDLHWGIDFWFECGDQIVTVDLTLRFKRNPKAHYVLTRDHFLHNKHYGIGRSIGRRLAR